MEMYNKNRHNKFDNFNEDDYIDMIKFYAQKNLCVDIKWDTFSTNCNIDLLDLFDDSKTKGKFTCIPLKVLEYLYKKYVDNIDYDSLIFDNEFEKKRLLYKILVEKKIISFSSSFDILKKIKYFFKILIKKPGIIPEIDEYKPFIDDLDTIKDKKIVKYCEYFGQYLLKYDRNHCISSHEAANILANMLKFKNILHDYIYIFNNLQEWEVISDFKSNFYMRLSYIIKIKKYKEGYIPLIIDDHWCIFYFNLEQKYLTLYDSGGTDRFFDTKIKISVYFYNHNCGFKKYQNQRVTLWSDLISVLLTIIPTIEKIYINNDIHQNIPVTCGFYMLSFVYLLEKTQKTTEDIKKVFFTLSLLTDYSVKKLSAAYSTDKVINFDSL